MLESLKSLVWTQRLLLAVSAALFVVAPMNSPDDNEYQMALDEFRILKSTLDKMRETNEKQALRIYEENGTIGAITKAFGDIDISNLTVEVMSMPKGNYPYKEPYGESMESVYNDVVERLYDENIVVCEVELAQLGIALDKLKNEREGVNRISAIVINPEPESEGSLPKFKPQGRLDISINLLAGGREDGFVNIANRNPGTAHVSYTKVSLVPAESMQILKDSSLVVEADGRMKILPKLREVWTSIERIPFELVEAELETKARDREAQLTQEVSILGVSMRSTLTIVVGPVLLIYLMFQFLSLVLHVHAIAPSAFGSSDDWRQYPWVGFRRNRVESGLLILALLLPVAAVLFVVNQAELPKIWSVIIVLTYLIFHSVCALPIWAKSSKLQKFVSTD